MSNGFPGWSAIMRSCPDKAARADMILLANDYMELEQGEQGVLDIPIVPHDGLDADQLADLAEFDEAHNTGLRREREAESADSPE